MRHSDPRLTANLYADAAALPTFDAVNGLAWHEPESKRAQIDSRSLGVEGRGLSLEGPNDGKIAPTKAVEMKVMATGGHHLTHNVKWSE